MVQGQGRIEHEGIGVQLTEEEATNEISKSWDLEDCR